MRLTDLASMSKMPQAQRRLQASVLIKSVIMLLGEALEHIKAIDDEELQRIPEVFQGIFNDSLGLRGSQEEPHWYSYVSDTAYATASLAAQKPSAVPLAQAPLAQALDQAPLAHDLAQAPLAHALAQTQLAAQAQPEKPLLSSLALQFVPSTLSTLGPPPGLELGPQDQPFLAPLVSETKSYADTLKSETSGKKLLKAQILSHVVDNQGKLFTEFSALVIDLVRHYTTENGRPAMLPMIKKLVQESGHKSKSAFLQTFCQPGILGKTIRSILGLKVTEIKNNPGYYV